MDLLLFSNSTNHGGSYLGHAAKPLREFLDGVKNVFFIPFALSDHDTYTNRVQLALEQYGVSVTGAHTPTEPKAAIRGADAVFVGGGNTFRLTSELYARKLLDPIREYARAGGKYFGASAGTNVACPSLRTTNDMPIVEPPGFSTLGLVPFQINAHYLDADPSSKHAGESRAERLDQFLEDNPGPVVGLREGTHVRVTGSRQTARAELGGAPVNSPTPEPAVLFSAGDKPRNIAGDVSFLLQ